MIHEIIRVEEELTWVAQMDFCQTVLECTLDPDLWDLCQKSFYHCFWVIASEARCVACLLPQFQHYDNEGCLHASGRPAYEFANASGIYAYHGTQIP